ncbi:hypothetical protein, partial [Deinococcus sp.]|uniref:hypothetical protein n=1 Tax=Deinococcus sp. TaxID=47478 RepID=UPI002869E9E4
KLARFTPADRAMVSERIRKAGGRANYEAACRATRPDADLNSLLSLPDLISALRAAKVEVQTLPGLDAYLQLRLPGGHWQGVNLSESTVSVPSGQAGGAAASESYVYAAGLIGQLKANFNGNLSLTGLINPTLHIGPAQMQLGTAERPVRTTNLYASAVFDELSRLMAHAASGSVGLPRLGMTSDDGQYSANTRVTVDGADGSIYALVGTMEGQVRMAVHAVQDGQLALPCDCRAIPLERTGDLKTLLDWAQQGKAGLMVYAVKISDLRHLTLTPVPAAQVNVVHP